MNPNGGTPLPDAMWRVGELFAGNLAGSGLPGATDPLDPVTGKCQPNFHLLSTDGYWNSTLSYASRGNDDQTVPALANLPGATGFTPGSNFPRPYYEGPTATSNSLADLAMHYWIRDLRPGIADKVKDSVAPWQHVTIYGLSIGARGTINYPSGINAITSGTANWPPATGAGGPEAIDDLWHAAVNSRGKYFNASNAQQLAESIVSALADFTDQSGTGTAVGIGGAQLSVTNQYAYKTSYEAGIWGDVKKYAIDIDTGVLPVDASGNPLNAPLWSAATQLDVRPVAEEATLPADTGTDTEPDRSLHDPGVHLQPAESYVLQAYGGDIKGNVWRFDLSNPDASQWRAEKIATLKDATNKPQPITTGVRIEIDQNNNVDRYLFVGTGKLLDQQDLVDTSVINSFYVIRDGTWTAPEPAPAIPYSRANLPAVTGTSVAGIGTDAHRPRLVPGRHRRQPQDQLGRLCRRQCRRVRLFQAVDGSLPRCCLRPCTPAI